MLQTLIQRTLSLSLAVVVTLGMLGSINALTLQPAASAAQWAQQANAPRA